MLVFAHRGASADAPENTLEAFLEAGRQGADGVELDAMVCGSGEVVVCHDERLDRLANLRWDVRTTAYWKLRRADVGSALGFEAARIPLLEEVLEALPAQLKINVELKCDTVEDGGLAEKVASLVRRQRLEERVIVSSFNPLCLFRMRAAYPELRRGFLIDPDKGFFFQRAVLAPLTANHSIHPHLTDCSPERVRAWKALGLQIIVWTVDDGPSARALAGWGVDACITNRPAALRRELGAPGPTG